MKGKPPALNQLNEVYATSEILAVISCCAYLFPATEDGAEGESLVLLHGCEGHPKKCHSPVPAPGRWKAIYERGDHFSSQRLFSMVWQQKKVEGIILNGEGNAPELKRTTLWCGRPPSKINWPSFASVPRKITLQWNHIFTSTESVRMRVLCPLIYVH